MATFADMATLLLTFFVILLSMSTVDVIKFRSLLGSMEKAFGVQFEQPGEFQVTKPEEIDPSFDPGKGQWQDQKTDYVDAIESEQARAQEVQRQKRSEALKEMDEFLKRNDMEDNIEVSSGENGIRIRVKGALMFPPGQADLKAEAISFLDNLVKVQQKFGYNVVVEGHTDNLPISSSLFPSNWELSAYRATAVLRYLLDMGIPPKFLTAVGLADNFPIAGNESAEGRAENRRVEFLLMNKSFRPDID